MKASLILATYEMPRHLKLVFAALERQSFRDFEVLLCDDGSGAETRAIVDEFRALGLFPLDHLWQENRGFRKCRLLNEAIRRARGEVLVFLDGDCVPHRHFMRDHWESREPGRFLAGRRVELGRGISDQITPEMVKRGYFDFPRPSLILSGLQGETEHLNRTIRLSSRWLRKLLKMDRIDDMKGCNFSTFKADMEAINGFDESYEGYGREDTDVELRLQHYGLKIKSLKGLALQYHVWHERRGFTPQNEKLLEDVKESRRIRALKGLTPA